MPSNRTKRIVVLLLIALAGLVASRYMISDSGSSLVRNVPDFDTLENPVPVDPVLTSAIEPEIPIVDTEQLPQSASVIVEDESASTLKVVPTGEQASLWKAFAEARHMVEPLTEREAVMEHNQGVAFFANNPGNGFTARFLETGGVRLASGNANSDWSAELYYGQNGVPRKAGNSRIEIDYADGNVEWYENKPAGLEHGITVYNDTRGGRDGSRLEIALTLDNLSAQPDPKSEGDLVFVDANGNAVLGYQKLLVLDANGASLDANMMPADYGVLIAVNDYDAQYPITIDPLIVSFEQRLGPEVTGSGGSQNDNFGYSLAISGDTVLIGVHREDHPSVGIDAGGAYVFTRSGSVWTLQAKLESGDADAGDEFALSVSLSGDTALIGAWKDDTAFGVEAGSAYVYTRSGSVWTQEARLEAGDAAVGDQFGISVSIDGETALIGAHKDDTVAGLLAGSAYVFTRSGSVWTQQAKLETSDAAAFDYLGDSVALNGDTALVGAPYSAASFSPHSSIIPFCSNKRSVPT